VRVHDAHNQYIRWLVTTKDLSPHTIRAYEGDMASFKRHLGNRAQVSRIDNACLVAFVAELRSAGLSSPSIRRRIAAVRGFCRWLLECDLLDQDPAAGLTLPTGQRRALPRVVPSDELDRLFTYLQGVAGIGKTPNCQAVRSSPNHCTTLLGVALMVETGIRVNEVVNITSDDIDLDNHGVRIVGKGRRERQVFLTNAWLTALTSAYMQARGELRPTHERLLLNSLGEPLTTQAMRSRLSKAACAAGLRAHVTPHMLRHTAATQLIEAGVDIRFIQRLLGHANLTTTELYTHVSDGTLRRVITSAAVLERYCSDN
jgi:site-specific recombinase XerD